MHRTISLEERRILELWTELRPDDAYAQGIEESAGHVFVPSSANVKRAVSRIDRMRSIATNGAARFLTALRARLSLSEPPEVPESLLQAFFMHMVKEGVNQAHLASLALDGRQALEGVSERSKMKSVPPGMRALTLLACQGLAEVLIIVAKEIRGPPALGAVRTLQEALEDYQEGFELDGFAPTANFEDVFEVLRREGCELGRSKYYARALRDLWDYSETPRQVESAGLQMLRRELPRFQTIVENRAATLGCERTAEGVEGALREASGLRKDRILPFLLGLRDRAFPVACRRLVKINPHYEVRVIETPAYLVNVTPSAAAYSLDTLTDRPRDIFLVTTDERSAGHPTPAELLNLVVHEEYGHCVHGSNSAHAFAGTPGSLDLLNGPSDCVSEGLAFKMEMDFLPILQSLAEGDRSGSGDEGLAAYLDEVGGVASVARDYEFHTLLWRIVRILRVVGDARINSGKQDLVDFVEWAHKKTGLRKATIYYELFPAHQILGPGYASTYAIIGENIRRIQERARRRGKALEAFNAYATSIGWPPKSVFEAKLKSWADAPS